MQNPLKFSTPQTHGFRSNIHQDMSENLVRVVMGSHQSFAKSFDAQTIYDKTNFIPALERAYSDYRNEYRAKKSRDYPKDNSYIISRFVQLNLTEDGKLSVFTFGRTQVGYLRAGKAQLVYKNLQCKQGDILYINIEANPSFDPNSLLMVSSQKDSSSLENYHFPLFYIRVEEESAAITPVRPTAYLWRSLLVLGILTVLSVGGWWRFKNSDLNFPTSTVTTDSIPMNTEDSTETIVEEPSSTPILSDFPQTDSLLTIYYQSTPRTLEALDKVAQVLNDEQANNPQAAQAKWEELKEERKTLFLTLLEPLDIILNRAENAYRNLQKVEYQNLIDKADEFFREDISTKWQDVPIVKERIERLNRIKSYNSEPDINSQSTN
ncbi:hypothetical protein [Runella salmonicolor]|uniref:Uncharacterized protein n=1 Tax=Runella salmonicolor TaxID=2950278 RepID=A0ABT1FWW2_9BACT|nr:hypothetical protein [Runella salmonicolor]MCP1386259.1 hypothetical protein [Runella salmonicolor]